MSYRNRDSEKRTQNERTHIDLLNDDYERARTPRTQIAINPIDDPDLHARLIAKEKLGRF